jgi:hypothetical protein
MRGVGAFLPALGPIAQLCMYFDCSLDMCSRELGGEGDDTDRVVLMVIRYVCCLFACLFESMV